MWSSLDRRVDCVTVRTKGLVLLSHCLMDRKRNGLRLPLKRCVGMIRSEGSRRLQKGRVMYIGYEEGWLQREYLEDKHGETEIILKLILTILLFEM